MKAATYKLNAQGEWSIFDSNFDPSTAQIVLVFGEKMLIQETDLFKKIDTYFPNADKVICSTSGEIYQEEVNDDTISIAALQFDNTEYKVTEVSVEETPDSFLMGQKIYKDLEREDLSYIMLFSDGSEVNGTQLIQGVNFNNEIKVTGGLAGDGPHFKDTLVGLNEIPNGVKVVAIGFYGEALQVAQGSNGGLEEFGISRKITKSKDNILYEVDDKNILDLYKKYLGKYSEELPGSALFFPLSLEIEGQEEKVVRTILGIDEEEKALIFAGDMPEGSTVKFMKSNTDNVILTSKEVAKSALNRNPNMDPKYALVVSCVGRKLVLRNRTEEEIEEVQQIIGDKVPLNGFYSYGEISTPGEGKKAVLHNQTLTITLLDELS